MPARTYFIIRIMQLAKVIGTLWASRAIPELKGYKILILCDETVPGKKEYFLAVDTVDAGVGDVVLTVSGSASRQSAATKISPSDTAIVGIVDPIGGKK